LPNLHDEAPAKTRRTDVMRGWRARGGRACGVVLAGLAFGCGGDRWPDPPPLDRASYQAQYQEWLDQRRAVAAEAIRLIGVWLLPEGETPFGSDASLPIVLPVPPAPARAGAFRRVADRITVLPATSTALLSEDGAPITGPTDIQGVLALGSLRLQVEGVGEGMSGRRFVTAWDEDRAVSRNRPAIETYPLEQAWRVTARFVAFDRPKSIEVGDVRGGIQYFVAPGHLVFRVSGHDLRLTALTDPEGREFLLMFKDETNRSSTYSGYRVLSANAVGDGAWTVLDFNFAANPPCAYSPYTLCPLPPAENRLAIAVTAGEKRFSGRKE
jgi:hypothetical protein